MISFLCKKLVIFRELLKNIYHYNGSSITISIILFSINMGIKRNTKMNRKVIWVSSSLEIDEESY